MFPASQPNAQLFLRRPGTEWSDPGFGVTMELDKFFSSSFEIINPVIKIILETFSPRSYGFYWTDLMDSRPDRFLLLIGFVAVLVVG